ncbi:hypothetical protein [Nocardioides sp.]|uniref:hypothetical protein n=1 Tax=Nocardioides sp. TaxID=35761 RepID=UPI001A25EE76|nr:hypothetical protein [Nocardioides sp.]MBJ7359281.1 hypothetical protein [Nocardioides sp.]
MRRLITAASALLIGATMLVPSPASAASVEMGNSCTAGGAGASFTVLMVGKGADNPLPITAPSAGVLTKARFTLPTGDSPGFPQKLKVARSAGAPNQYTVVGESGVLPVVSGVQTFDVRVPIAAGDLIGLQGGASGGVLYCNSGDTANVGAVLAGDPAVGSTATYSPESGLALPVVVTLEPDADKDGYGDETQDQCPQSAAAQGPCPIVKLDSFSLAQDGSILVLVGTSESAKVKVTGKTTVDGKVVKLGGKKKQVKPGKLGRFKVAVPPALRAALAELPSSKFIKVTFTASATDTAGRTSKDKSTVKLRGTR